jgi:hypothetical protein
MTGVGDTARTDTLSGGKNKSRNLEGSAEQRYGQEPSRVRHVKLSNALHWPLGKFDIQSHGVGFEWFLQQCANVHLLETMFCELEHITVLVFSISE